MTSTDSAPASPWRPLRHPIFRWLWIANVASNLGTWLQSVGASWLMTTLSDSTTVVALVQAATSLPMFLLALPGGALADVLDRRKILLLTQGWMLVSATGLGLLTLAGIMTPWLLLLFIFLLGTGAALNGPAWQSVVPELVPREELPAAVALGSIGFNIARAIGPALGGVLVAAAGPAATFLLNAASFLGVLAVLYRWRRPGETSMLPAERILGAMRTGLRYVRHAPEVQAPIIRGTAFMLCGSSLWAVLPVVARVELRQGPAGYGLLLTSMGAGAVAGAMALPRLRRRLAADGVVAASTVVFAAVLLALAWVRDFPLVCVAMVAAGGAWLSLLSTLNVAVQTVVPAWVRGRALSVYLLFFFGSFSLGSTLWGVVAERAGIAPALTASAVCLALGMLATASWRLRAGEGLNLAPSRQWPAPIVKYEDLEPERGPVLVTVEYRIDPERAREFAAVMQSVRRIRLRDGAMQWGLFADAAAPELQTEFFLVKSWAEHLRQHERVTVSDRDVEEQARSFHAGPGGPVVRHLIAERVPRG
jgi:MFS family permease